MSSKLNVAVIGLGFGQAFVPIYRDHPLVGSVTICDLDSSLVERVASENGIQKSTTDFEKVIADETIDAVHLLTPVPLHASQVLRVLETKKHCACAVPMATSLHDIGLIIEASKRNNRNYMLMETAVYSREFLLVKEMLESGELGNLTFLKGEYFQDLEGNYPAYWRGIPPMHYATHSLSPLIAIADDEVRKVSCFGSSTLKPSLQQPGGNSFPIQSAIFKFAHRDICIQLTRSWFQIARAYTEAFSVYGDLRGFEWPQLESEDPILYELEALDPTVKWRDARATRVKPRYRPDLLPHALAKYAEGGHGGSHPHLVHEFITSIAESRAPYPNAVRAAQWTAPGICADLSSNQDGDPVLVPSYS